MLSQVKGPAPKGRGRGKKAPEPEPVQEQSFASKAAQAAFGRKLFCEIDNPVFIGHGNQRARHAFAFGLGGGICHGGFLTWSLTKVCVFRAVLHSARPSG